MKLLVDTHCWLWYLLAPEKLNAEAQELLRSNAHEIYFSAVSAWEIVIKHALGKLRLPIPPTSDR
ncbi:MAG TPA: type II toxin-antitoxin system VapC family toxin [Polyangiaceae bacterium]|nr:type II toxin-antitoxin system VapC family toxin [Polyangiaceae bacterium]